MLTTHNIYGTTIDHLIETQSLNCPNYIKLDVDGIEHKILRGANNHLSNTSLKGLSIELNQDYAEQYNSVLELMKINNFFHKESKLIKREKNESFSNTFNHVFER